MRRRLTWTAAAVLLAAVALGHDFWIEPSSFRPVPGAAVNLRLLVGDAVSVEPVAREPARIKDFFCIRPDGSRESVDGINGKDPAGILQVKDPGLYLVGYRSRDSFITLDAPKFEAYLREEGLDHVIEQRAAKGASGDPGRETYSRCAKSILLCGEGGIGDSARLLGLTLELIPEKNPYALHAGDELPIKLVYEGHQLTGALVAAVKRTGTGRIEHRVEGRTDREGRVVLRLPAAGEWIVKCVHMVESPLKTQADWQSLWASLTFELPSERATSAESKPATRSG